MREGRWLTRFQLVSRLQMELDNARRDGSVAAESLLHEKRMLSFCGFALNDVEAHAALVTEDVRWGEEIISMLSGKLGGTMNGAHSSEPAGATAECDYLGYLPEAELVA